MIPMSLIVSKLDNPATSVVAAGMVVSPIALPPIEQISTEAAMWAPILGGIWLLVQIMKHGVLPAAFWLADFVERKRK